MTRPDARLLVPVSALPGGRAPEGARRVLRCGVCLDEQVHYSGCDAPDAGDHCTSPHDCGGRAAWFLDLSRPDVVDGAEVRLDALGWALGVLAKRYGYTGSADVRVRHDSPKFGWHVEWPFGALVIACPDISTTYQDGYTAGGTRGNVVHVDVSRDGLSDDDASRAVVAAALRGGA